MADAVKLLLKEDITPIGADAVMFTMAPIIFFAPSIIGAVPLLAAVTSDHPLFHILNLPTGIFYVLAAGAIPVVALVMAGWSSNNKYSLVGGLRSAAQAISYEIPLVLSLLSVCLMAGTLDMVKIGQQQAGGILNWNILGGGVLTGLDKFISAGGGKAAAETLQAYYPFGGLSYLAAAILICCLIVSFCLYLTGACAEINRIPFDLPEAESELVSGYNTEYSGMKFAIFFLAEFTNLFIVASIATVMFLGGGDNIFKVYSIVYFAILVRGTLPRFRIDQLIAFGWKRLIPLAFIIFLVLVFARGFVICHG
jgi:NADH-quinone oxidoreductase subunit H